MMAVNDVPLSPISFMRRAADVYRDKVALVAGDGAEVSWTALRHRSDRMADALRHQGIRAGERVAILASNDIDLLCAHYGVPGAGGVLVALNTRLSAQEYRHLLGHSGSRVLLVDPAHADRIDAVTDDLGVELVVGLGADVGDVAYDDWVAAAPVGPGLVGPEDERAPITINYTSGTTGSPKGAIYTHRGAYLNALGQVAEVGLRPDSTYLWTLPMFHCNGWCFTWAVTAVGATHVCLPKFEGARAVDLLRRHGVTHLSGAPVVLADMAAAWEADPVPLGSPILAATGGAPPTPRVIETMRRMGVDVVHLYGLTETYGPSVVCEVQPAWQSLDDEAYARRTARQGVRSINVESVRVVDETMQDVPADAATLGEIVIRGNTVTAGYLDAPEATAKAFEGGWFHTGDLAVMHPDGYLEIRDRSKDIIISGGENVSSIEVENTIASHPAVREVAVVAAPHDRWDEVPIAFVTLRPGTTATEQEIIDHVRERLAHFKAPKAVRFTELPKTSTGKVQKYLLRGVADPLPRQD